MKSLKRFFTKKERRINYIPLPNEIIMMILNYSDLLTIHSFALIGRHGRLLVLEYRNRNQHKYLQNVQNTINSKYKFYIECFQTFPNGSIEGTYKRYRIENRELNSSILEGNYVNGKAQGSFISTDEFFGNTVYVYRDDLLVKCIKEFKHENCKIVTKYKSTEESDIAFRDILYWKPYVQISSKIIYQKY